MTLDGDLLVIPLTCDLALYAAHMSKCFSSCTYLKKQHLGSVATIRLSCFDLELLHDDLFIYSMVIYLIARYFCE